MNPKEKKVRERGRTAFNRVIDEAGGVYNYQEVANLLDLNEEAVLNLSAEGGLLSFAMNDVTVFPVWQFNKESVIKEVIDIVHLLDDDCGISKALFFLTYDEDLGKTPIEAIKQNNPEDMKIIHILVKQYYVQVAR